MFWRVCILVFLGIANVVLFYRMVWSPQGLIAYHSLKEQHKSLENRVTELDKGNIILSKEIRLLQSDDKYVEKMIRQRLHYVRDNEVLYLFTDTPTVPRLGAAPDAGKN